MNGQPSNRMSYLYTIILTNDNHHHKINTKLNIFELHSEGLPSRILFRILFCFVFICYILLLFVLCDLIATEIFMNIIPSNMCTNLNILLPIKILTIRIPIHNPRIFIKSLFLFSGKSFRKAFKPNIKNNTSHCV